MLEILSEVRFGQLLCARTQTGTSVPDEPECKPHATQRAHGHGKHEKNRCGCRSHASRSIGGEKGQFIKARRVSEGLDACFGTPTYRKSNGSQFAIPQYIILTLMKSRLV